MRNHAPFSKARVPCSNVNRPCHVEARSCWHSANIQVRHHNTNLARTLPHNHISTNSLSPTCAYNATQCTHLSLRFKCPPIRASIIYIYIYIAQFTADCVHKSPELSKKRCPDLSWLSVRLRHAPSSNTRQIRHSATTHTMCCEMCHSSSLATPCTPCRRTLGAWRDIDI